MNSKSSSFGNPLTLVMTINWSICETGNPHLMIFALESGDKGKHDYPGKRGYLSNGISTCSGIICSSSPKIQPSDHTSILLL